MQKAQEETRIAQVEIWTDKFCITGSVHIPLKGGYKGRLSDLLNKPDVPFVSLTDVTVLSLDRKERLWRGEFLALNKVGIVLVKALQE